MGSEDLFHKRKARAGAELQRRKLERKRNKRYLIVCEGTKTEPNYLQELLMICVSVRRWFELPAMMVFHLIAL